MPAGPYNVPDLERLRAIRVAKIREAARRADTALDRLILVLRNRDVPLEFGEADALVRVHNLLDRLLVWSPTDDTY
jgi:hypothetical protein